ncbi:MAG TPA: tRNA lysidine(34) synthetase TilS [Pyrinomonadaceae bacterium]|jgi:tRNA(Ile)-lysidine synthase
MRRFERELITEWRRLDLPVEDGSIVVAVSGGADSVSLLLALDELRKAKKIGVRFIAAHFNHRLRGDESDADEAFVRELTSERKIELAVGHSTLSIKTNVEQNARVERYDFLQQTAANLKAVAVLTAHTVDDQAETFLLNLIRGSGIQGLSAMSPVRRLSADEPDVALVRPLLRWARRADTEVFCHDLGIQFRSDTMNEDESFTRVRVRKILIPLLRDFNPKIVERLAETARLLRSELPTDQHISPEPLKTVDLLPLAPAGLITLLRAWLGANRGDLRGIELKHIEAIGRLIHSRKSGKTVELPGGDAVFKQDGRLCFSKNLVEKRGAAN